MNKPIDIESLVVIDRLKFTQQPKTEPTTRYGYEFCDISKAGLDRWEKEAYDRVMNGVDELIEIINLHRTTGRLLLVNVNL